ncbi:MAG: AMP-binding protein, partial [Pseudoalteromonas sp.]|nr:AMP-binding protein [Pseudoalteromonas sp.]
VYQGYGLSEAASVVSLNTPNDDDVNSAGEVLGHVETKVENDELFIKGALFLGYLNQAPHNPNTWYATGDLVSKRNNKLYIKGRVKNLIITSMGRNVSAEWPESLILSQSAIQQAVVFGESQPFLSALIYAAPGFSDEQLKAHLKTVNQQLPDYAQIKKWHRLAQPLNEQQGLLTANNRPKRAAISQHYSPIFEQFYRLGEVIHE